MPLSKHQQQHGGVMMHYTMQVFSSSYYTTALSLITVCYKVLTLDNPSKNPSKKNKK